MLTFTEEILLLLLDDKDGSFVPIAKSNLGCAIAGAVLMDLAFANRIDTDPESLIVTDRTPTGNPILDPTLNKIAAQGEPSNTRTWIRLISVEDSPAIREQALQSLVARGIVVQREARVMWAFRARRYPSHRRQRGAGGQAADRGTFCSPTTFPTPRDVALIGLVDACDILRDIFAERDMEQCRPRIDQLRKMDLIGPRAGAGNRRYRAHRRDVPCGGALLIGCHRRLPMADPRRHQR